MERHIEKGIETPDGVADCMIELQETERFPTYSVTILYPNIINGFSRSEVHCFDMTHNAADDRYTFDINAEIHPKIKKLEAELSAIIHESNR